MKKVGSSFRLALAALTAGTLIASCGQRSSSAPIETQRSSEGMRRIEGAELVALVRGSTMHWVYPDPDAINRWSFGCDAELTARGGFLEMSGAYSIENDEICVTRANELACHRLFVGEGYFLSPQQATLLGAGEAVNAVRFDRNANCP